jgi:hypothetical protein
LPLLVSHANLLLIRDSSGAYGQVIISSDASIASEKNQSHDSALVYRQAIQSTAGDRTVGKTGRRRCSAVSAIRW